MEQIEIKKCVPKSRISKITKVIKEILAQVNGRQGGWNLNSFMDCLLQDTILSTQK